MSVHKLDRIFNPKRIALIGVTPNPNSVGGKLLSNLVGGGFRGVVYPVNPTSEAVLGIQCYPDIKSLPKTPDLAVICTASNQVPKLIKECGEAGILGIIIISAGFREIGQEGKILEDQIRFEMSKFDGMRIIGPNCLGIIAPKLQINISFAHGMPQAGHIAFISQSGALCTSVLDWAIEEKIGFSHFVSIGNTLDLDFGDFIDYFGEDENTKSIILYVESITNARKFISAGRAFARTKPIIVYKAGRFPESANVAASHTGAMASEDGVYDAVFERMGLVRVYDIGDIFDCAELVGRHKIPRGPHLGIVTNAGGPGVMATDTLIACDGKLGTLSNESTLELNESLPPYWSHRNPVDVLGDAGPKRISKAVESVVKDKGIDAVLVIITPQAMTNPSSTAKAIGQIAGGTSKPILAAWLGGESMREGIEILNSAGVPTYNTPEQAVRAFMTLVRYGRNLEILYETPKDIPVEFSFDRKQLRTQFSEIVSGKGEILSEDVSKTLLKAYGINGPMPLVANTSDQAVEIAQNTGYPVVLKIHSPQITHKSDVGGVALNLKDEQMVRAEFDRITQRAKDVMPQVQIEGVTVQKMIDQKDGVEMIIGTKKDPVFGTVIMVGMGGITAELFGDTALGFPPLSERLTRRMIESLKIWPLLQGYRGRPMTNISMLIEVIMRLSYLAADYPEIKELEVNPLLVTPKDVVALDARIIIDTELIGKEIKPYSHLALPPYPEEYVCNSELSDGTRVKLRPIKPEDEPLWFKLLGSCSKESLYMRFRYFFHWETHEVASRYCFNDYDREIAIVAECTDGDLRKLLGVGRLVADPEHETAEYAVLVSDVWQNKKLGSILTDYCLKIAERWGVKKIVAQTSTDNPRMVEVFRKRGFSINIDPRSSVVDVVKKLS